LRAAISHLDCIASRFSGLRFPFHTYLVLRHAFRLTFVAVGIVAAATTGLANTIDVHRRSIEIESYLFGFPTRALSDLEELAPDVERTSPAERHYYEALYGQALVAAGKGAAALQFADKLEREARHRDDNVSLAVAALVRGYVEVLSGESVKASAFAKTAQKLLEGANDFYLEYWAAMTIGITARARGEAEEALENLQRALSSAESAESAYRQSTAHYQLSTLYLELKQPEKALEASKLAFRFAETSASAHAMVAARIGESSALQILGDRERELAAMEEALAIALKAKSKVDEGLALINLADIRLRRKEYSEALDLSRRSLELAREFQDLESIAASKANVGFALFGLGRAAEGRHLADEAMADYERRGARAEVASLSDEYSQYLEGSGDYRAALALERRARKLYDEIAAAAHQRSVLELQEKYEADKRRREIELLNRQNALKSAKLENRVLEQRIWWLLAGLFAVAFFVYTALYRKLRASNELLAVKNRELGVRSSLDPLTALYNRRYFQDFMREERKEPERRSTAEDAMDIKALLLIDIDLFKQTNDRYGHSAGDTVLVAVAQRLRETLRETDMIVRWGGEEFLVFVPATHPDKLDEIATRVMHAIAAEPIDHQGSAIRVTASIGYAPVPLPPDNVVLSWERAINLVDMALYMAKVHGRNRAYGICRLHRSDDEALATIERDLEKAWEEGMVDMRLRPGPDLTRYAFKDSAWRNTVQRWSNRVPAVARGPKSELKRLSRAKMLI
jgi:diguanylate cyclase (GGDEF)-like protein